ncbi:MAG: hypothetical protein COA57_00135 [Flavobacteriales bacterium]|nr:MAG: hypothetical protein COA57_00135 [Flavobacteriales bacterium]
MATIKPILLNHKVKTSDEALLHCALPYIENQPIFDGENEQSHSGHKEMYAQMSHTTKVLHVRITDSGFT